MVMSVTGDVVEIPTVSTLDSGATVDWYGL